MGCRRAAVFAGGSRRSVMAIQRASVIKHSMRRKVEDLIPAGYGFDGLFLSRLAGEDHAVPGSVDLSERCCESLLLRQRSILSISRRRARPPSRQVGVSDSQQHIGVVVRCVLVLRNISTRDISVAFLLPDFSQDAQRRNVEQGMVFQYKSAAGRQQRLKGEFP